MRNRRNHYDAKSLPGTATTSDEPDSSRLEPSPHNTNGSENRLAIKA